MMTSGLKAGDVISSLNSEPANTNTQTTQRHSEETSRAEPRSKARSRRQKQTPGRSRFLKYPLRYILPKPPMSSGQPGSSEAGAVGQPSTARVDPPDTDDKTAPHPEQESWSVTSLPDILYILRPGPENAKCRHRVRNNVGPIFGKMIRNLPVLPTRISSQVEGWRLETWMRLDRRVTPADILDRVNPLFRMKITEEDVGIRRHRFRETCHIAHWGNQKSINEICRLVKQAGRDPKLNSTRGLTPGLIVPAEGEAGGRISLPPDRVPIYDVPVPVATSPMHGLTGPLMQEKAAVQPRARSQNAIYFKNRDEAAGNSDSRIPMNGQNQALNQQELKILYETPTRTRVREADQSVGEFPTALVVQPHTPDNDRKRKAAFDPVDVFKPIPRAKRQKHCLKAIPIFPEYPSVPTELASHRGPPARVFPEPNEPEPDKERNLEQYLEQNNIAYFDFLNARYQDDMDFPFNLGAGAWI